VKRTMIDANGYMEDYEQIWKHIGFLRRRIRELEKNFLKHRILTEMVKK
jgi:hypothetical protein